MNRETLDDVIFGTLMAIFFVTASVLLTPVISLILKSLGLF